MANGTAPEYNYEPRSWFVPLHEREQRWAVVIAHRRCGKSVSLVNELIVRGLQPRSDGLPQQFAYIAPQATQARRIAWEYVKSYTAFLSKLPGYRINEQMMTVTLPDPNDVAKPGSKIMLLGAENAEAMRGLFLDGCVLDEYQDIPEWIWKTIIRPALADRQGFAIFSGTVKGRDNALWVLHEHAKSHPDIWFDLVLPVTATTALPQSEVEDMQREMTSEAFDAEMLCNPDAVVTGRILLAYLNLQQITQVPWQPDGSRVFSAWDLGMSDAMTVWTGQMVGREVHLLDYYENSGEGLDHYVTWLSKLPYAKAFGSHLMPHDIKVRELGAKGGQSRYDTARQLGLRNIKLVPKLPKSDQIDAARMLLPRCWFDERGTHKGVKALRGYKFEYDQKRQVFSRTPLHDKNSNGADSYQTLAVGLRKLATDATGDGFSDIGGMSGHLANQAAQTPWSADNEVF